MIAVFLAIAVLAFEAYFLARKFPLFVPSVWTREAVELADVGGIRIGIVRGRHGAEFVRLRADQPALAHLRDPDADEVEAAMRAHLSALPLKIAFEVVLYFSVVFGVIFLPIEASFRRRFSRMLLALIVGLALFVAVLLLQLPLLFGYDTSMFTTWYGPGAYSWSKPAPRITGALGVAVSYRYLLEALMTPALKIVLPVIAWFSDPFEVPAWVFNFGVAFLYGVAGAIIGLTLRVIRTTPRPNAV